MVYPNESSHVWAIILAVTLEIKDCLKSSAVTHALNPQTSDISERFKEH